MMVECQELNWNVPPINGTSVFFTPESFERFSYTRTYDDDSDFEAFLRRKNEELTGGLPSRDQGSSKAHQDGSALEKRFPVSTGQGHEHGQGKKLADEKASGVSKAGVMCQKTASVAYPRKSWLNLGEQRRYLELYTRYHNCPPLHPTEEERIEMNILKELHTTVSCEQEEFQKYLRHLAECNVSSYNFLQPAAKTYIQEKISHACKRVRQYPRFYETIDAVSLTVPVEQKEFPPLVYVRPLLELGQVPKVILPNMSCGAKPVLPTDHDKVSEHCPPAGRKTTASNTWNKQACSQDWNAEVLAQKYGCQIVLSSGGLKCLLDNQSPGYQRDWQLPVIVKEYPVVDNGKTFLHKVVYIDKPLVNQKMTVREKNSKFHKAALKTLVCNILKSHRLGSKRSEVIGEIKPVIKVKKEKGKTKSSNQSVCKKTNSSKVSDDFFSSGDIEMDSLETFGMSAGLTRQSKKTDTKMAEDDGIKPKSADVTKMSSHEISTEFTAEPVVKVEVDNIATDNIATGKVATDNMTRVDIATDNIAPVDIATDNMVSVTNNMATGKVTTDNMAPFHIAPDNMATGKVTADNMAIDNEPTEIKADLIDVKKSSSTVSDEAAHSNVMDKQGLEECDVKIIPGKKLTERPMLGVKLKKDGGEKNLQGLVLKTVETVCSHQDGVPALEKGLNSVNQTEVSKDLSLAVVAQASEVERKSVSVESHVSVLDDEFEEEVIVIRRRRGRPRKAPASPVIVKRESVNSRIDLVEPIEEAKTSPVRDVKQEKTTSVVMVAPEAGSSGKMCLRRSPRVLQRKTSNLCNIQGFPVSQVAESPVQPELQGDDPVAKLFVSDGQSTETSDDDKLVIAEPCSTPTHPAKTSTKGAKSAELSVSKDQIGRHKSIVSTESSDDESHLIIDAPEPVESEKSVTRRRSLRISAMSAADSADADTEADTPKPPQKRARKTRGKKAETKAVPLPTESPHVRTERRRSGRLAAKDKVSIKVEPSDQETQKETNSRQTLKRQKDDSAKATSPETERHDLEMDNRNDVAADVESKVDPGVITDVALATGGPGNIDNSLSPEKIERHLSEIEEIQEPSDMSEADADSSHPLIIPLSPVYTSNVTMAMTDISMQPAQPELGILQKHGVNDDTGSGFTSPKARVRRSSSRKTLDPLNTILSLQDKMLHSTPVHNFSSSASPSHPTGPSCLAQSAPHLSTQSRFPPHQSQAPPHNSQAHPQFSQAPAHQFQAPPQAPAHQFQAPPQAPAHQFQASPQAPAQAPAHQFQAPAHQFQAPPQQPQAPAVKENPSDYQQPQDPLNVTYHLWSFGGRMVLIRCSCHGYRRDGNQRMSFLTIATKLEYQTNYGMEQMTSGELVRDWISCYIRQNCPLIRARVNGLTSELVMLEEVDAMRIIPQCQSHLPPQGLQRMNKVLSKLDTLEVGSYLLSHSPGDSHCKLRKAVEGNKRGAYDLHFTYTGFTCTDSDLPAVPPWIPIDPAIILPSHWKKSRIPATFDPPDFTAGPNVGQKRRHFQAGHHQGHHNTGKAKKNKGKKKQFKK